MSMEKQRVVQEYVPGKQVTLAHLIAHPKEALCEKLGVGQSGAIGILTITPCEAALIAADVATKTAAVDIGFMDRFTEAFFGYEDAAYLRALGVNLIRVPINHHLFWNDQLDEPNPFGFEQLERLASICVAQGLYFLPDLHTTPGGQNPDWHSECRTGTPLFWEFEAFQKRAVKIWSAIAERLNFADRNHFTKQYIKKTGVSPARYRKSVQMTTD